MCGSQYTCSRQWHIAPTHVNAQRLPCIVMYIHLRQETTRQRQAHRNAEVTINYSPLVLALFNHVLMRHMCCENTLGYVWEMRNLEVRLTNCSMM
jgi:hypothetical protein